MTIGIGVSAGSAPGSFENSNTVTVSPAASGSTFVVVGYCGVTGTTASNMTDTHGNTYTLPQGNVPTQSTNQYMNVFVCPNAVGGTGTVVTWTAPSGYFLPMQFIEITGANTSPLDQSNHGGQVNAQFTTLNCPSITTTSAKELILGITGTVQTALSTITATSGTLILQTQDTTNFLSVSSSFQVVSSINSYAPTFNSTNASYYGSVTLSFIAPSIAIPSPAIYNRKNVLYFI